MQVSSVWLVKEAAKTEKQGHVRIIQATIMQHRKIN